MANDLANNPMVLDTTASAVFTDGRKIQAIVWVAPTTVAHTCVLIDKSGGSKKIWSATCAVANEGASITFPKGLFVDALYLNTLGSGTVYIYLY